MYSLVVPELHNIIIHGKNQNSYKYIDLHYLCILKYPIEYFYNYLPDIYEDIEEYKLYYIMRIFNNQKYKHPFIRNYKKIQNHIYNIEIALIIILNTNESICILKTFWLKIIQRKWRKIYKIRKEIINKRKNNKSLFIKELTGKYPIGLQKLPSINGMLFDI